MSITSLKIQEIQLDYTAGTGGPNAKNFFVEDIVMDRDLHLYMFWCSYKIQFATTTNFERDIGHEYF